MKVRIFTDGACSGNPGPGGWALIISLKDRMIIKSGGEEYTTNNRMELLAVVNSLKAILNCNQNKEVDFEIHSDSAYVINAIQNNWIKSWLFNGWRKSTGEEIANQDLWKRLNSYLVTIKHYGINLDFVKVKGHSGNPLNELADREAVKESNKFKGRMIC